MNPDENKTEVIPEVVTPPAVVEEPAADPIDQIEDVEELRKTAKSYRSSAMRYKKDAKQTIKPSTVEPTQKPYNILEDEVFDFINEGYSKEEIRFIQSNGGRKSLEDANSLVAIAVKAKREQRNAEEAAGKVSDKSGQSEVERKYTTEQMRNMKPEELAKLIGYAN